MTNKNKVTMGLKKKFDKVQKYLKKIILFKIQFSG